MEPNFTPLTCNNCGASLQGRYCVACGQDSNTHVPTLAELIGDGIASLLNLESRLWRTLGALFFKPGSLTLEYLAGRRARYVPPLRLYLVLSVFLFLIIAISDSPDNDADEPEAVAEVSALTGAQENSPVSDTRDDAPTDANGCNVINLPFGEAGSRLETALREACVDAAEDNFRTLGRQFVDNIPLLAFMVIPVMAAVLKLFYAFSARQYLAHLAFLCHTHAFTFLLIIVMVLLGRMGDFLPALDALTGFVTAGLLFYMPSYYFLALRRVYGQGRLLTLFKLVLLMFLYLFATILVFSLGFAATLLTS